MTIAIKLSINAHGHFACELTTIAVAVFYRETAGLGDVVWHIETHSGVRFTCQILHKDRGGTITLNEYGRDLHNLLEKIVGFDSAAYQNAIDAFHNNKSGRFVCYSD